MNTFNFKTIDYNSLSPKIIAFKGFSNAENEAPWNTAYCKPLLKSSMKTSGLFEKEGDLKSASSGLQAASATMMKASNPIALILFNLYIIYFLISQL